MAEAESGASGSYVAFISYSHKDAAVGRWLHRRLESYRLPSHLAGTEGEYGEVPARLIPIFRDRDELPAARNLSEKVRAALSVSKNLIVLCSPHSATSPWVAKEIATFRELHPDRPIFTAIIEGEPGQCFPPPLREDGIEPLAADLTKEGDGRRLGLLKLVAGLAGVGLDQLVQRDAARRIRRITYVTAAAVAAVLAMILLTGFALNARAEAERQRREAEGLVEFMLTDLRDRLKGVGRLDVLTTVNQRALDYYQSRGLSNLPPDSLERRARLLHAMGEDDLERDQHDRALAQFREAARITEALLAAEPDNPERIFAHSQSEFWVGRVDYDRARYAAAKPAFERYKTLIGRLLEIDPARPEWLQEAAYAEGNLCSIALAQPQDVKTALRSCAVSLALMEKAAAAGGDRGLAGDIANRKAWLADAYVAAGDRTSAWRLRKEQEHLLGTLTSRDPKNLDLKDMWLTNQFALAELDAHAGRTRPAQDRLRAALAVVNGMIGKDPENATWVSRRRRIERDLNQLAIYPSGSTG